MRGADSFDTHGRGAGAPSRAWRCSLRRRTARIAGFLGAINVFSLWATVLLALGMTGVGRIPRAPAWTTAIVMLLLTACFAAFGARNN